MQKCGFFAKLHKKAHLALPNAHPTPLLPYSPTPPLPYFPCLQPAFTSQHPLGNWSVFGLLLLSFHLCPYYVSPYSSTPLLPYSSTPLHSTPTRILT